MVKLFTSAKKKKKGRKALLTLTISCMLIKSHIPLNICTYTAAYIYYTICWYVLFVAYQQILGVQKCGYKLCLHVKNGKTDACATFGHKHESLPLKSFESNACM